MSDQEKKEKPAARSVSPAMATIIAAAIAGVASVGSVLVSRMWAASDEADFRKIFSEYSPVIMEAGTDYVEPDKAAQQARPYTLRTARCDLQPRKFVTKVTFTKPFPVAPRVTLGINGLDIAPVARALDTESTCYADPSFREDDISARIQVYPQNIGTDGFDIVYHTWNRTAVHMVIVDWVAFSQIEFDS